MKKVLKFLIFPLTIIAAFFSGIIVRQPQVNKLKKQLLNLQNQLEMIQSTLYNYQDTFNILYLQYKGLKLIELKKKADYELKLKNNLVLQYGIKDYINILFDKITKNAVFSDNELEFYEAFDNVLEGKKISNKTFSIIKNYIMIKHNKEINSLQPCDCKEEFKKIENLNK